MKLTILMFILQNFIMNDARLNVVLIIADDLRPSLGCYGDRTAFTPNIDSLAQKSFIFLNAFVQQSLCGPSRNSFLTSRRPDTTRLYDFYSYWRDFAGNFTTLPQYFRENGYKTKSIGKVFHPGISSNFTDDAKYSWTEKSFHPKTEKYKEAKVCYSDFDPFVLHRNIVCPVNVKKQPLKTLPDIEIAQEAISTLTDFQNNEQNFFLAIGFHKPHIPLKYPKKYKRYYPLRKIKLPKNRQKSDGLPDVAWNPWTDLRERDDIKNLNISFPFGNIPDKEAKLIIQSYYSAVTYVDDMIGKIIKILKNNTIVVLLGDHGWSLGEHGEWSKYSNFDKALKVPFIIKLPNEMGANIITNVELVDLFPTLVELSGLERIPKCPVCSKMISTCTQGKSLIDIMFGKNEDNFALSQFPRPGVFPTFHPNSDKPRLDEIKIMGYTIRTNRYRFTDWVKFDDFKPIWEDVVAAELYDHFDDPDENVNRIQEKNYSQVIVKLRKQLRFENSKHQLC